LILLLIPRDYIPVVVIVMPVPRIRMLAPAKLYVKVK